MKIFISEYDRHNAYRAAVLNIAKFHRVQHPDFKSNMELYEEIANQGSPLLNALDDYLNKYDKWFEFYQKFKKIETEKDIDYQFNDKEKNELTGLATNRQNALDKLQKQYDAQRTGG